ncbi:hypothetical protein Leryth_023860 [Lithospermum erythrorhizon]|nr:hypothetical protein Leryth_023860 [Lithospermum erythrorhizon]
MSGPSRFFKSSRALFQAASKASASAKKATPKAAGSATPKRATGILKLVPVSSALSNFLGGAPEASRTEAVKKVWEHIKLHNLQNPANKREINCDDKLKTIFDGKDKVGFLEIAKLLSCHFEKAN